MAARPAKGPHESSRLVCEAVRRVSNTVSRADTAPIMGAHRTEQEKQIEHPESWGEKTGEHTMQRVVKMPNTSSYFRTKDVENARAILVVPHKVSFDVPTNFNGMAGTRHEVEMDAWVFHTQADVENGTPEEMLGVTWGANKGIARALNGQIGNLVGPFRIVKESQNGKSFWTTVDLGEGEPAWKPVNDFADALCAKMSATPDAPSFNDEPLMPDFGA